MSICSENICKSTCDELIMIKVYLQYDSSHNGPERVRLLEREKEQEGEKEDEEKKQK